MEALVNIAYDRISEDVILLYDTMRAYNQAPSPRPPVSAVLQAMYRSLMKDSERARGSYWQRSYDDLPGSHRSILSEEGSTMEGHADDDDDDDDNDDVPLGKESHIWEFARDLVTSMLSDLAVIPFWTVKVSAVAHRGRLPELWPFIGYRRAIMGLIQEEGVEGLFRGWGPICAAGLLRYFRRSDMLYTDYYWKTTHRVTTRFIMRSDYSRHVNDPEVLAQSYEGIVTRMLWASILHPFDLLATRMITESRPEYATMASSVRHVLKHRGLVGLFVGVRSSILNVILPFGNWYLLGVPFLIKTRRMLEGMDTEFRVGMGGSLDMVRAILKDEGISGLFAGNRATLWGIVPAFASLCGARLAVYMVMGSSRRTTAHRRRRNAHLRSLMKTSQTESEAASQKQKRNQQQQQQQEHKRKDEGKDPNGG